MEQYWQGIAAVLITSIVGIAVSKQGKDMGVVLTLAVCCIVAGVAVSYMKPVVDFVHQLEQNTTLTGGLVKLLLKATGIGLIGQIATMICNDSGNSALGKMVQLLTTAVILWLSLPIFQELMQLLQRTLENV